MRKATCRGCGAPILMVLTAASGREMPLDREPAADGNVIIVDDVAVVMKQEPLLESAGALRYKSHFATCPQADQFRRRGK